MITVRNLPKVMAVLTERASSARVPSCPGTVSCSVNPAQNGFGLPASASGVDSTTPFDAMICAVIPAIGIFAPGTAGLKANLLQRLLIDVNLIFKLDENGLRDKVTPLVGFEYAF